jgi:uncharacterized membrane-anchored protein
MGKRQVYSIPVRKPVSALLLVVTSAAMIALISFLSGRAYAAPTDPLRMMLTRSLTRDRFLAFLMPVIANVLLFIPWGFLAFVVTDRPSRPRRRTYVITVIAALCFAAAIHLWQRFLPMRVTMPSDAIANALGALGGAALGHMRKGVRVRFDF